MKKLFMTLSIATLLGGVISCSSTDVFDPAKADTSTTSLKVPADFNWATTRGISCSLTTPAKTAVNIYKGKECLNDQLLVSTNLPANQATKVSFELPTECAAFYVQYPTANGMKVLEQKVGATTRVDYSLVLSEAIEYVLENADCYGDFMSYMPAKGTYGTLMFEDQFPNLGDYDMNDFVAGYYIEAVGSNGTASTLEGCDIYLQIRAIGGSYPYRLCVELPVFASDIADNGNTFYKVESDNSAITAELLTSGEQKAIFAINGTTSLKEGSFFNTEEASTKAMPTLHIEIRRDNQDEVYRSARFQSIVWDAYACNFFLQNTSTRQEIHLRGYETTALASNPGAKFASSNNLVWGIKVPKLIAHPKERIDITKAYPKFAGWVTSGGNQNTDWYETSTGDDVIK